MPLTSKILNTVVNLPPADAWTGISLQLRDTFFADYPNSGTENDVVGRDRGLSEMDNLVSGSAWDLWQHFENSIPKTSQGIIDFWHSRSGGKAVLILDGLSLREVPWLLDEIQIRGYKLHRSEIRGSELPAETTPFAKSLGFSQRSALENNQAGAAHKLAGAFTACSNLPWKDCVELVGSQSAVVFWHHWPDERLHLLSGPGLGLRKLAKEAHSALTSDDFWAFVERLATGRRLVITSDHGYAACGEFHDLAGDQSTYMKSVFKSGRSAVKTGTDAAFVPPIDLALDSAHGKYQYVLGRRKWKSAAGYPTLQHGGLSLLELFVPFLELSK